MSLVLSNKGKGMQSSSEQPLVGEERYVTTRITAAKETRKPVTASHKCPPFQIDHFVYVIKSVIVTELEFLMILKWN